MRLFATSLLSSLAALALATVQALAQAPVTGCAGLCLQQVSCPNGGTTTVTGIVYAPNGVDPLPGVIVYVPNAPVDAFTPGVSCPVPGANPSGSPLAGDITGVDGTFTITNFPVGPNIPLVAVSGKWRRQVVVPNVTACTSMSFPINMPANRTEGDIPHFAISTAAEDAVECVLRKVGISDSEFTDPTGNGRIHLYTSTGAPGSKADANTPTADTLMGNISTLNNYDVVMLPCEGNQYTKPSNELANLVQWTNAGGRVYASHFSYAWMFRNPPFDSVVNWDVEQASPPNGTATIDQSFVNGQDLATWLTETGASTTNGQIAINTLKHDFNGVVAPTQSWMTLNNATYGNPVMQFTFNTPVGKTTNQCGRVLFNEYHVENPSVTLSRYDFPNECSNAAMTPQEKLLEFMLFDLTSDNSGLSLSPTSLSFGNTSVGFGSGTQTITVSNSGTFEETVGVSVTGTFNIVSNTCSALLSGQSCQITISFTPTGTGAASGTVTVTTNGKPTTATLTGIGTPAISTSGNSLSFGNVDVGATATKTMTFSNISGYALPLLTPAVSGSFSVASTTCGSTLAAGASCDVNVSFTPTTYGQVSGNVTLGVGSFANAVGAIPNATSGVSGNGVDFALALAPSSGTLPAGFSTMLTSLTTMPLSGFNAAVNLTCTTNAPGGSCVSAATNFTPTQAVSTNITVGTTSTYTVIGYGGFGERRVVLLLLAAGSVLLLYRRRRRGLGATALLALIALGLATLTSGCSGNAPGTNANSTAPGTYAFTLSVTDGFLVHTQTFNLTVTKN